MHTIRLKINDNAYDKLVLFLSKFGNDEVEIINEDVDFQQNQGYLEKELAEIRIGKANFIGIDEAEVRLNNIIKGYEDRL
jgi:hypothetical protein